MGAGTGNPLPPLGERPPGGGRPLAPAELAAIVEPFAAAGFELELDRPALTANGSLRLDADVYERGVRVAWFDRVVDGRCAWHRASRTEPEHRRRRIARRLLAASVALYDRLGVEEVRLVASADGRYAWARCGFDFADEKVAELAASRGIDLGSAAHAWEVAAEPAGRELLLCPALDAWEGVLDLRPGSPGRRVFERYCAG